METLKTFLILVILFLVAFFFGGCTSIEMPLDKVNLLTDEQKRQTILKGMVVAEPIVGVGMSFGQPKEVFLSKYHLQVLADLGNASSFGIPLIFTHQGEDVLGVLENFRIEDGVLKADLNLINPAYEDQMRVVYYIEYKKWELSIGIDRDRKNVPTKFGHVALVADGALTRRLK